MEGSSNQPLRFCGVAERPSRVPILALAISLMAAFSLCAWTPPSASAASISVRPQQSSITLGQAASLRIKLRGLSSDEIGSGTIRLKEASFPYDSYDTIRTINGYADRWVRTASPQVNSRYIATFVSDEFRMTSIPSTVYVNPLFKGGKWLESRRTLTVTSSLTVYSRQLRARWYELPRRMRTVYFYQRCWGTPYFALQAERPATEITGLDRMRITSPGFTFTFEPCDGRGYTAQPAAWAKFPGYFSDGDDGAGRPTGTNSRYRTWTHWAGRNRIPIRVMNFMFSR